MKRGELQGLREDLMGFTFIASSFVFSMIEDLLISGSATHCDPTFLVKKLTIIHNEKTWQPNLEHRLKNAVPVLTLENWISTWPYFADVIPRSTFL